MQVAEQLVQVGSAERPDGVTVVWARGEVDLSNARYFEYAVLDEARDADAVVLDLSRLDFLDSAGISAIYRLGARLDGLQIVVSPHSLVRRTLELAGLAFTSELAAS
jgi:anti-anti-sigma factor